MLAGIGASHVRRGFRFVVGCFCDRGGSWEEEEEKEEEEEMCWYLPEFRPVSSFNFQSGGRGGGRGGKGGGGGGGWKT